MILENSEIIERQTYKVARKCDECGKIEMARLSTIKHARKKRGNDKDYCKKCSYLYRGTFRLKRELAPQWNGGRYLNENGYWRVYVRSRNGIPIYDYEHKVILSKHLGRDLLPTEKVHHIDLNKQNNEISNFYIFQDKSTHGKCHQSMETLGYSLIGTKIWFDFKTELYTLVPQEPRIIAGDFSILKTLRTHIEQGRHKNGNNYLMYYLGNRKHRPVHRLVAELITGEPLEKGEHVHHINGVTLDNTPENIVVLKMAEHIRCHESLQRIVAELYKSGIVKFENGIYFLK